VTKTSLFLYEFVGFVTLPLRLDYLDFESFFMDEIHQFTFYAESLNGAVPGAIGQQ
jgi:hypothetical protein